MIIRDKVTGDLYKNLMNYIISKSDVLSVSVNLIYNKKVTDKFMKIITYNNEYDINNILNDVPKKLIEEISEENKNNTLIFDEEYINNEKRYLIKYIQNVAEEDSVSLI